MTKTGKHGLALAGGGPLGGTYEIGALIALDEAIVGIDIHELDVYVGVSAGAFVAANLANRFSIGQLARIFIANESDSHPIGARVFTTPAYREYWRALKTLPGAALEAANDLWVRPFDGGLLGALAHFGRSIPNGLFDNEPMHRFLSDLYRTRGHSNDFRKLQRELYVIATDLDTSEAVVFGSPDWDDIPISRAVQASTALPGLYPPVEIDGGHYVDGALKRTLHASVALRAGCDLLFCINPIVPYDVRQGGRLRPQHRDRLVRLGLPAVLSQTLRSVIQSRMDVGMKRYDTRYEQSDVLLFEPSREDSRMFFSNVFSYSNRRHVTEHAYQATRRDLLKRRDELAPILAKHGLELDVKGLRDRNRRFDTHLNVPLEARQRGRYKNTVTNKLSKTLDELQRLL